MVRLPQINILYSKGFLIPRFYDFIGSNFIHFSFFNTLDNIASRKSK